MTIVLLFQVMGGTWEGWGWFFCVRIWVGGQGVGVIFFRFFFVFVLLVYMSFMAVTWEFVVSV